MADLAGPFLADTSVWARAAHPKVIGLWRVLLEQDLIATAAPVRLEVLFSARSAADYEQIAGELDGLRQIECGGEALARALEVQRELAHVGGLHHRSVKIPDLLIAAAAELAGVPVLHYDSDYDRIATVTGQATEWVAPQGSL